jgi:predicted flap endonuclease-1-like 5' DNA nuclease
VAKLTDIEGVGSAYAAKLQAIGVETTDDLLAQGTTPKGRQDLADKSGISGKLILEWINHLDLERVKGIGWEYADLLEEAGVDTVPELAQRNAANLHQKLVEINDTKNLVRKLPSENQVADWVTQAKDLPRVIQY